jgi:hypothetical protein
MDKRIGNYIFWAIIFFCIPLKGNHRLQLRVLNKKNDQPVTKLALGVPYTLELKAEGNQDLYKVSIPGLEDFHSEFCGASHMNLMSHVTTVHTYVLRADKLGTFTLGPVELVTSQGTVVSNTLALIIEQQEQSDVIVHMAFDTSTFVVGQRVQGRIRVHLSQGMQLINLQLPALDQKIGQCTQQGQHQQSRRILNGKTYECFEFPLDFIFNQSGCYSLPKIGACCRIPVKNQHSSWGFSFLQQSFQDQWFYSTEDTIIQIDPLPAYPDPVDGVGVFSTFSMAVDHTKARIGEGIVLTLQLEGKDGIQDAKQPQLTIPAGLKYYESKTSLEPLNHGSFKKSFEYIVQGLQSGTWEIPAQTFTFFDTKAHSYKTLKTQHKIVTINESAMNYQHQPQSSDEQETVFVDENALCPINNDGPWTFSPERSLSWIWFFLILIIPCCTICYLIIKNYIQQLDPEYWLQRRKKYAFKQIRKRLIKIKKSNNVVQLYEVFTQLFVDRCQISCAEMNAEYIEKILKNAGFLAETIDQWNRFFHQLAEYAFFKPTFEQTVVYDLLNRAQIWINQLEEKL